MTLYEMIIKNMSSKDFETFVNQFADAIEANTITAESIIEAAKECAGGLK